MKMMDELKPLFLYSSKKKVYAPINEKDRRHNSAILLLTPSIEASANLMNLPYIHNPNLFNSFYIDRNVMAYIDNISEEDIDFDEIEEEAMSEAFFNSMNSKTKVKFDDRIPYMDKKYAEEYINKDYIYKICKQLKIPNPEEIDVHIYPNISIIKRDSPNNIKSIYDGDDKKILSYSKGKEIHLITKRIYDPESMSGSFDIYIKNELITNIIYQYNQNLPFIIVRAIAQYYSGLYAWKKDNNNDTIGIKQVNNFAKYIDRICSKGKENLIIKFIKTGNINIFSNFIASNAITSIKKAIFESELSYFERQRLLPSEFGVPNKRKYPMPDEEHVKLAIKMFNSCDPSDEEELAESIIKKIKKFGISDIKVGISNRFKPYFDTAKSNDKNFPIKESFIESNYADILHICNHLSKDELKRVTFYDTYRDSKFVIKRIIKKVGGEPAGFLDVYQFPTKPYIAQITIAVDNRFRGEHIADSMVKEMLSSNLQDTYNFSMYYWTAHTENVPSQELAKKNGFKDTGILDKYGRKVFINIVKDPNEIIINDIKEITNCISTSKREINESSIISNNIIFLQEADTSSYSQRLKKYLYKERIKNNKGTLEYYSKIKQLCPFIKKTYIKLDMYKKFNIFVDLSYYHGMFLNKNKTKLDKAVNFYFDFINRLISNKDIDKNYTKQTIFIPIDSDIWGVPYGTDITDYKKNLNPISIIARLVRTNPDALKKAFGNKNIIFVGSRGYFTIDFNNFEMKNLSRFKTNIRKLTSIDEPIVDDFDIDTTDDDEDNETEKNIDSSRAIAVKIIDKVEQGTSIKLDNISASKLNKNDTISNHLSLSTGNISIGDCNDNTAIIMLDPDGPSLYEKNKIILSTKEIPIYCMPNK